MFTFKLIYSVTKSLKLPKLKIWVIHTLSTDGRIQCTGLEHAQLTIHNSIHLFSTSQTVMLRAFFFSQNFNRTLPIPLGTIFCKFLQVPPDECSKVLRCSSGISPSPQEFAGHFFLAKVLQNFGWVLGCSFPWPLRRPPPTIFEALPQDTE